VETGIGLNAWFESTRPSEEPRASAAGASSIRFPICPHSDRPERVDNVVPNGSFSAPMNAEIRKTRLLRRNKAGPSGMSNYDHRIALTVDFS
jgi:hypothetical protein